MLIRILRRRIPVLLAAALAVAVPVVTAAAQNDDPYLWLEEVDGTKPLAWVEEQNAGTLKVLEAVPEFEPIHERNLEILNSDARIPSVTIRGPYLYNFWQDADHVRGLWRRTSQDEYRKSDPAWETVLDLDILAAAEDENWVWKGASCLPPASRQCMVSLSRGGGDATVKREFDTRARAFIKDGFNLPEAKSRVDWRDANSLWVGTDFGEGSLTTSGYPRTARLWHRGTSLTEAQVIFEGKKEDVSSSAFSIHTPEGRYDLVNRTPAIFRGEHFIRLGERLVKLDLPEDVNLQGFFKDQMLLALRSDWTTGDRTYPQDALLAIDLDRFLRGSREFQILFEPSEWISLGQVATTRDNLLLTTLDNVRGRLYRLTPADGNWSREEIPLPGLGRVRITASSDDSEIWFYSYTDFLTPSSLFLVAEGRSEQVKSMPAFFDSDGMEVVQRHATSRDGTKIPYFLITPKGFQANGKNPALLYGYGGFEVSMTPRYSAIAGTAWLERGGAYALANIRGGGEFGPRWHQAALRANRHKAFEDFIAVGEDLVATGVTSKEHLGIMGGSNGGLLVGASFTQRPDLFKAVVCRVPLLDMRRYNKLLAGASWMAEYGNPDKPEDWAFIKTWSPYQNLKKDAEYPRVFFRTSTRDDRVHPGHARKMVARMLSMDHQVYYYENTEGGHAGAANNNQRGFATALDYAYLWMMLR
ncbi:MAG: prolyl oligopeptidase family serine peptidase [Acidobacteria bacterium]|nr:prolyl oligopeptidase family serine peptidase [Acidobacteriota bacterium]